MKKSSPKNIDQYIERYPQNIQEILQKIRFTIIKAAPDAKEAISYQIPTFKLGENLVHFAAFTKHISFFPTSSGITKFKNELKVYETSKGTVRFPIEKPIPYNLISKITQFRVNEIVKKERKRNSTIKEAIVNLLKKIAQHWFAMDLNPNSLFSYQGSLE